ncbi:MAG TPA: ribosomal protein S18-alanine N-acetyltransferase [Terriglobales bacterium]|jgi:ribosomal-protein-alanine N-acetyltransferase|nr:ribosomal protein S18-alanine N-acetyltransferase [Terriglobales bacterium]
MEFWNCVSGLASTLAAWMKSEVFWTALTAIGSVSALFLIYTQIRDARLISAYNFLRQEDDRFNSKAMKSTRTQLAMMLLQTPEYYSHMVIPASEVLDFYENLGLMVAKKLAPIDFLWTTQCYTILRHHAVLASYVDWLRARSGDATLYDGAEFLYQKMLEFDEKKTKTKTRADLKRTEELRSFLRWELNLKIRPFSAIDIDRIMEIEQLSFTVDAYPKERFEELYEKYSDGFYVAEIQESLVGYIAGVTAGVHGKVDSMAVAPNYRRLGIGAMMLEFIMRRFTIRGLCDCDLEVRKTNTEAIRLYQKMGFVVSGEIKSFYVDGADATVMKRKLKK